MTAATEMGGRSGSFSPSGGVALLFESGRRPAASEIHEMIGSLKGVSVSFDPALPRGGCTDGDLPGAKTNSEIWLEVLASGLTYDLRGLLPGPPCGPLRLDHYYNCASDRLAKGVEAIVLEAGPHLAGGEHTMPVVRTQLRLASDLVRAFAHVRAVSWIPAKSAIAPRFFLHTVGAWLAGGPFPALGLLGFTVHEGALRSEGLAFFLGSELEIDSRLCGDRSAATRLAMRLAHALVGSELPESPVTFAIEEGRTVSLEHDRRARIMGVRPM